MSIPEPLPRVAAFEKLGFGLFVHWGLYSQLGQGEWTQNTHKRDIREYQKLKETFTAEDFNAEELVKTAKSAGMRYIVLTTRHHEGFSLYDTCGLNDYDAPHSPAKRDLVAEYVRECRKYDIIPFFYHTTLDWYWRGKETFDLDDAEFNEYLDYLLNSVEILCRNYGKIGGIWFDGNWSRPGADWKTERLYRMIRQYQPDAVIIDNTGIFHPGAIGHGEIDAVTYENQAARPMNRKGMEKYLAGEVCQTINSHWGIGANDFNVKSPRQLIEMLCHSRSCGANFLLNIGPAAQGGIPEYERAALHMIGRWIDLYGEAIYHTKTVPEIKCQGRDFLLRDGKNFYYFVYDLGICGNPNVTSDIPGIGSRTIDGFRWKVVSAEWMDTHGKVDVIQDIGKQMLAVKCNGYLYGANTCVRVMKLVTE